MIVTYKGYSFKANATEVVNIGSPAIRQKVIRYPGVTGENNLNMRTAGRPIVQSGTLRESTQGSLNNTIALVESLCDGERGTFVAHGRTLPSVYANTLDWGVQFGAFGRGGNPSTSGDYFGQPYTINYIELTP